MQWWEIALPLVAAVGAGFINTIVGSGTLITFPALLAIGLPPLSANISNNVGLVFGSAAGTWGYRAELRGQGRRIARLLPVSAVAGGVGAGLLLVLPAAVFDAVVPVLVLLGLVLVALGPWLQRRAAARPPAGDRPAPMVAGVAAAGVYGGYFGAAQGILLVGILGSFLAESLQRVNGLKNVLASAVNLVATVVFVVAAPDRIDWPVAGLVAAGSVIGGVLGARIGRRLPPRPLRGLILVVGTVAIAVLVLR